MPYEKCANIEQAYAIEELKNRVKNDLTSIKLLEDDSLFYKYLKAQDFNVDKAEKMVRKHIVWRKVYDVDNILETFKPKEIFLKCYAPNVLGYDKNGDLVVYLACGRVNAVEFFKCIKMNDFRRNVIWFAEKVKQITNQAGRKISIILNLDKLDFLNATSKICADAMLCLTQVLRDNYAERLKAVYAINAPSYYIIVFMLIKAVISKKLTKRLHVFGQEGWNEKFLDIIEADVLPAFLGGNRTDPDGDPYCSSFITIAPLKIPDSYHLTEEERYFENPSAVNTTKINPSEKKEIFVHVEELGSMIRWKFMVRSKTICFGLFFQESEEVVKEIIPMYEYDTSHGTEENAHKCFYKGKYIMVFDNSHSRFRSKEIQYVIAVEKPED